MTEGRPSGELAALLLLVFVLCPGGPLAAEADGDPPSVPASEARSVEERLEALEEALRSQERLEGRIEELETELEERERAAEVAEERIEELETTKRVQQDATRAIIASTLATAGSRINEFVELGGVIEVGIGREQDFAGGDEPSIALSTAELQLDVTVTDWARGQMVVNYDAAEDQVFATTSDEEFSVDRINIDTATITIGDAQRFPPYVTLGRTILPFGISTGDPVADVLTISDPLTVQVFETRQDAVVLGVEFPTPAPTAELVIPAPPPVRPRALAPLVRQLARWLGYEPLPAAPPPPEFIPMPAERPPFVLGGYFYDGNVFQRDDREGQFDIANHWGFMAAYRTKGNCQPYLGGGETSPDLHWLHILCPWTLDLGVEFNRSVFESDFLSREYQQFLGPNVARAGQGSIGFVPGLAANVRATLGPVGLIFEWNGALQSAGFLDANGTRTRMRPEAWQVSLAYQFDWKPWVEAVGAQGTYVTVGYSESSELQGVQRLAGRGLVKAGAAPERRLAVGVGEWVLPNVRVALEFVRAWDYSKGSGGTGRDADAILSQVTFEW